MRDGLRPGPSALLPYMRGHGRVLLGAASLSLVGAMGTLVQPMLTRATIGAIQVAGPYWHLALAMVVVATVSAVLEACRVLLLQRCSAGLVRSTRVRLVGHLLRLNIADHERLRTGDVLSRVGSDTAQLHGVITSGLIDVVSGATVTVGAVVLMISLDPVMAAVTGLGFVGFFVGFFVTRPVRDASWLVQERLGELTAAVERAVVGVRTIKASRAEDRETAAIVRHADRTFDAEVRLSRVHARIGPTVNIASQLAILAVLGVGGIRLASGGITVADLVAFLLFVFLLMTPMGRAIGAYADLQAGLGALRRIDELLRQPVEAAGDPIAGTPLPPMQEAAAVVFDNVSFTYPGGDRVLTQVSFTIPYGTRTALVGPSGAGKSTALALVERFYDVDTGRILVDGRDVRAQSRPRLRSLLGYVEQDAPVLAGTIRENLLLAAPDAADTDLFFALGRVRLLDLVQRSPQGLDTPVGEGGSLLSGGERQRLAIARALLTRAPILLLDEPTSNLDSRNEAALRLALAELSSRQTLIVVAHRLTTVRDADQILVFDAGRVVAAGDHPTLIEVNPLYRELVQHQLLSA